MIYKRELKRNLKGLLIWSVVMAGLILMLLGMYPQFAADAAAMQSMIDVYPEGMKAAFGMDTLNLATFLGFYGIEVYMMTTLIGSVYAALLASGILVKEESEKTIEFLLSKPVSREEIVLQKLGAVVTTIILFNGVLIVTTIGCFGFANGETIDYASFALLMLATLLLHLTVAGVAFLLSSLMSRGRSIVSLSLGIVFLSYALHIAGGISETFAFLKQLSIFSYVDAATIVEAGAIDGLYAAIMMAVILLSVLGALLYYKKKDIAV